MRTHELMTAIAVIVAYNGLFVCAQKMDRDAIRMMIKPLSDACVHQTGVSHEMVVNTHKGEFPNDEKLMCYFKCLFMAGNALNPDGSLRIEEVTKMIEMVVHDDLVPMMKEVGTACYKEVPPSDTCEYAFSFSKCIYDKDSSLHLIPHQI